MEPTRHSLILRVRDVNDRESWTEFWELYKPLVLSVALREGLATSDADDLTQEVFLRLREKLPEFEYCRTRGYFRGWLRTLTRNVAIDWRRKRQRSKEISLGALPLAESLLDGSSDNWDREYRQRILEFALEQVRATTDPKTWACFAQHTLGGRAAAEVAAELGLQANAVFVNSSRVLARLRLKCADYDEDYDEC